MSSEQFIQEIQTGYTFKGETIRIGSAILNGESVPATPICIPLRTMNRHGLIAGATGTGKTKTLQVLAEALSDASVPVLLMDIKGDLSGLAAAGAVNDKITDRYQKLDIPYQPTAFPVELLTAHNKIAERN